MTTVAENNRDVDTVAQKFNLPSKLTEILRFIGHLPHRGKYSAQVPTISIDFTQGVVDSMDRPSSAQLIHDGYLHWRWLNGGMFIDAPEPRNPKTGRLVNAFPYMTKKAVEQLWEPLYELGILGGQRDNWLWENTKHVFREIMLFEATEVKSYKLKLRPKSTKYTLAEVENAIRRSRL